MKRRYDLDRKDAKISALSSNNLDKYEYFTGEDLGIKPSTFDQAKFEYSPLVKIFNNGLDKDEDKNQWFLKRLKNIEDKNEELLKAKNKAENIEEVTDFVNELLSLEAKELIEEIRVIQRDVDYRKLKIRGCNCTDYDFSDYKTFKGLFKGLHYRKITIQEVVREQDELNAIIDVLEDYIPRDDKYIEAKNKLLNNVKKIYERTEKIIEWFKDGIFPSLRDLKEEIKDMAEEKKQIENSDDIVNLVEMILEFNRQQQGQGLKILRPNQMLRRLPVSLAQLKAGSNA